MYFVNIRVGYRKNGSLGHKGLAAFFVLLTIRSFTGIPFFPVHCLNHLDDLKPDDDNGFLTSSVPQDLKEEPRKSVMPGPGGQLGSLYPTGDL